MHNYCAAGLNYITRLIYRYILGAGDTSDSDYLSVDRSLNNLVIPINNDPGLTSFVLSPVTTKSW